MLREAGSVEPVYCQQKRWLCRCRWSLGPGAEQGHLLARTVCKRVQQFIQAEKLRTGEILMLWTALVAGFVCTAGNRLRLVADQMAIVHPHRSATVMTGLSQAVKSALQAAADKQEPRQHQQ